MRRLVASLSLAIILLAILAMPVFALSDPTSMSIVSVQVVHNTVETGDMAILFEYEIAYSPIPTTPAASQAFMFRLMDTTGTTVLSSQVPYVGGITQNTGTSSSNSTVSGNETITNYTSGNGVVLNGYGRGVSCFYFTAATAPTWDTNLIINISGSPVCFDPLPSPINRPISHDEFSSVTSQIDNQALAAEYIIDTARDLQTTYSGITLIGSTDVATVLSADGEAYFRGAVPGLNYIAPTVFLTQNYVPSETDMGYTEALGTQYASRMTGTDLSSGFTRLGLILGTSGQTLICILTILLGVLLVIFTAWKGWGVDPGMIGASIILTASAVIWGDAMLTIRLIMGLLVAIILVWQLYLKRA